MRPVVCPQEGAPQTRSSHESTSFNVGDDTNHDRTGQPVVGRDASHEPSNELSMVNDVDIDFRIPGLPHSVVKQAENSRVRELDLKIQNRPDRHAVQLYLQQKQSPQPVQCDIKENDSGHGQCRAV